MLNEKDELEQEAMKLLQKGQTDRALERYLAILKADPRDRRIRQKVAELMMKLSRPQEAERHYREIGKQMVAAGQEKAAVTIYQTLVKLKPDDTELRTQLGDCQLAAGNPGDARATYEALLGMLERVYPAKAVDVLRKIIKLSPGEFSLRVKLAELMEAANWNEAANGEWRNLSQEALRLGRPDDRARFLENALRLRPDQPEVRLEAAEARLAMNDPAPALSHLASVSSSGPHAARALTLTARALTAQEEGMRARQVWLDVARIHQGQGDALARLEALKAAQACGPDDPAIAAELGDADRAAERFRLRLEEQPWAAPTDEAPGRLVFRAQAQARYGFPERGVATLRGAPAELRGTLALRVALGEILSQVGDKAGAAAELAQVQAPDAAARLQLAQRLSVLRDEPDPGQAGGEEELIDDGPVPERMDEGEELIDDSDELIDDGPTSPPPTTGRVWEDEDEELIDDETDPPTNRPAEPPAPAPLPPPASRPALSLDEDEALGDQAAAAGRWDDALKLWRKALMRQPANTELLFKVSEALEQRSRGPSASAPAPAPRALPEAPAPSPLLPPPPAPLPPAPLPPPPPPPSPLPPSALPPVGRLAAPSPLSFGESPDFSDIFGGSAEQPEEALTGVLLDARAWMMVGRPEQALRLLDGSRELGQRLWSARARRLAGDLAGAASALGAAIAEAADSDPDYPEALFEFAGLNAATGKLRAARRALDELEDLDPNWRPADMAVLRRGLELLG